MNPRQMLRSLVQRLTGSSKYHYIRPLFPGAHLEKRDWTIDENDDEESTNHIPGATPLWFTKLCDRIRRNDPGLVEVNLAGHAIRGLGAENLGGALRTNTHIQVINLSYNDISDAGMAKIIQGLANDASTSSLEELHLDGNHMGVESCVEMSILLAELSTLRELYLSDNPLTDEGMQCLSETLSHESHLEVLELRNTKISDDGLVALSKSLPHSLRELDLSDNTIGPSGIEALVTSITTHKMPLLKLQISHNRLGDQGASSLAQFTYDSHSLEFLDVSHNEIEGQGANALLAGLCCSEHSSLSHLNLSHNDLHECRQAWREALAQNTSMKALWLDHTNLGDEGVQYLSDGLLDNVCLESLHLSHNNLTTDSAVKIAHALRYNRTLRELVLTHNPISQKGVQAVLETLRNNYSLLAICVDCVDLYLEEEMEFYLKQNQQQLVSATNLPRQQYEEQQLAIVPYRPQQHDSFGLPIQHGIYT